MSDDSGASAPLAFGNFLERMRHPSAADLVRSIKGFISSFSTSSAGPSSLEEADEDGVKVQSFMENMENTFRSHSLWRNATEEELDAACEGLEKYLMTKLYVHTFTVCPADAEREVSLAHKMMSLKYIRPEHLDIPAHFRNESSWLLAQNELRKMNSYKAPRDKLVCILNCCKVITNLLNVSAGSGSPAGADDFLPVLIYIVIQARPQSLHANLQYVQRYRRASRLVSEPAYFFTQMLSAQAFIERISDASSLSLEADEFNELISKAVAEASEMEAEAAAEQQMAAPSPTPSVVTADDSTSVTSEGNNAAKPDPALAAHGASTEANAGTSTPPASIAGSLRRREVAPALSVEEVESAGGSAVAEAAASGELIRSYKFLFATSGDLALGDVPSLLDEYKELVLKYESLKRGLLETGALNREAGSTESLSQSGRFRGKVFRDRVNSADTSNPKQPDGSGDSKGNENATTGGGSVGQDKDKSVFTSLGNSLAAAGDGITSIFRRDTSAAKKEDKQIGSKLNSSTVADGGKEDAQAASAAERDDEQARHPLISLASDADIVPLPAAANVAEEAASETAKTEDETEKKEEDVTNDESATKQPQQQQDASALDLLSQLAAPATSAHVNGDSGNSAPSTDSQSLI